MDQSPAPAITGSADARALKRRSLAHLLRMGHCAPTIMQTLLDESNTRDRWPVKLLAGMPGGIGNTGNECGGITAPLVLLGMRHGRALAADGVPVVVLKGQQLIQRFAQDQGTTSCRVIRSDSRVPLRCIGVIMQAPLRGIECAEAELGQASAPLRRHARARLCAHWRASGFHCAHAVLRQLDGVIPVTDELLDATTGFMGGTAMTGMTCSAMSAGIMALGLAQGEIEDSRVRVVRMIATMVVGGEAFADELNAFNKTMNLGNRFAHAFAAQYGSTQCHKITQADFCTPAGVEHYMASGGIRRCEAIADAVARQVKEILGMHVGNTGTDVQLAQQGSAAAAAR
jgi:C_GCAxxG_C_C family probable redox protein